MSHRRAQNRMRIVPGDFTQPTSAPVVAESESGLKSILKKRKVSEDVAKPQVMAKKKKTVPKVEEEEKPKETLRLVLGTYDSCVAGYDYFPSTNKLKPLFAVKPHIGYISGLALSDKWIVSGASDEAISIFSSRRLREIGTCGSEGTPTTISLIGNNLLVSTSTGVLQIFRTTDWMTIWKEQAHKKRINDVSLHPSGSLGITVGDDNFLKLWDFSTCKLVLQVKLKKPATFAKFSPSGNFYVLCTGHTIEVYDLKGRKACEAKVQSEAHCGEFINDTSLLLGLEEGVLQLFTVTEKSCTSEWTKEAHPARIRTLAFAADENKKAVVSACSSGSMVIWEVDRSKLSEIKRVSQGCRFTAVSALWKE